MTLAQRHTLAIRIAIIVISVAMVLYHARVILVGPPEAIVFRATHTLFALLLAYLIYSSTWRHDQKKTTGPVGYLWLAISLLPLLYMLVRAGHFVPRIFGSTPMSTNDAIIATLAFFGLLECAKYLFYRNPVENRSPGPTLLDYAWLISAVAPMIYIFVNYNYFVERIFYIDDLSTLDVIMATACIITVLESTKRVVEMSLPIISIIFIAYGLFFVNLEPMRTLDHLYMTTEGIFGLPIATSATFVLIFVIFGAFMERTGTGQLFMDFAMAATGHTAGGPGKVSVVSSSLFGTISGSAVANVMVDGPISIPLMKRSGFPPHFAAGVEATASTGGQIMPPIMGAAAFVMAEILSVPYAQIVIWAVIPAILYYVACFAAVHFEAKRRGILGVPRSELPKLGNVFRERGHLGIPIFIILAFMYGGYSAPFAALMGTLFCFPVAWFGPRVLLVFPILKALQIFVPLSFFGFTIEPPHLTLITPVIEYFIGFDLPVSPWVETLIVSAIIVFWDYRLRTAGRATLLPIQPWAIIEACVDGAKNSLGVALACAAAGVMIGVITLSGMGIVFTQWVVALSQSTLFLALVMTAIAGLILGTGLPTTPSYIIMTALLIPAVMKLGVIEPAAHMFAFYYAILSSITPPVALAVFAAAGLAKADMWQSSWAAMKIGTAGFIIPFMFAYQPALLMIGTWQEIVVAFCTSSAGIAFIAGSLHGYFLTNTLLWHRIALGLAGFLLIFPGIWFDLGGIGLGALVIGHQYMTKQRERKPATP
jgi:TRAP transporter 4TM/12TM fusion protein